MVFLGERARHGDIYIYMKKQRQQPIHQKKKKKAHERKIRSTQNGFSAPRGSPITLRGNNNPRCSVKSRCSCLACGLFASLALLIVSFPLFVTCALPLCLYVHRSCSRSLLSTTPLVYLFTAVPLPRFRRRRQACVHACVRVPKI